MSHITDWPADLKEPGDYFTLMPEVPSEEFFWSHLSGCKECQEEFCERYHQGDQSIRDDVIFWGELQDYVRGIHPTAQKIVEFLTDQAGISLVKRPSKYFLAEITRKWRGFDYHLQFCRRCSLLTEKFYYWLGEHNTLVYEAEEYLLNG